MIPNAVVYAGLAGTLLSLIVATATNNWQPRVFFLLALRLAIGWHFFFEGMHKIHSHAVGPTETNRPFSSEPYFKASQTEVGAMMRKEFDDPQFVIASKVRANRESVPGGFDKRPAAEQAAECPKAVADQIDAVPTGEEGPNLKTAAKATYARWVFGVDGRPTKVKFVTGDVSLTAPQRLAHIDWLRGEVKASESRRDVQIGNGNGVEMKRAAELRTELVTAESDLAKDANAFVAELKTQVNGGKPVGDLAALATDLASDDATLREAAEKVFRERLNEKEVASLTEASKTLKDFKSPDWQKRIDAQFTVNELVRKATPKPGQRLDTLTSYFIAAVGGCLLAGLLTRLSCVLGAGFLFVTYLTFPAYPWLPQPPNTEGNPLFVNKNIIEALALLALACFPTGRWLGLDAIIYRVVFRKEDPAQTNGTPV